ncbi:hypothetical protein [Embleya sp. NPDC059237]|uniref:hypothetical protein n=1 Tax=Embleya sp. NPDC059237 TaxID=3346784 RepID=UPI0036B6518B
MSTYRLDYISTDLDTNRECVADQDWFEARDDTAAKNKASRLMQGWGRPADPDTEHRGGRLWTLRGDDTAETFVANVRSSV